MSISLDRAHSGSNTGVGSSVRWERALSMSSVLDSDGQKSAAEIEFSYSRLLSGIEFLILGAWSALVAVAYYRPSFHYDHEIAAFVGTGLITAAIFYGSKRLFRQHRRIVLGRQRKSC